MDKCVACGLFCLCACTAVSVDPAQSDPPGPTVSSEAPATEDDTVVTNLDTEPDIEPVPADNPVVETAPEPAVPSLLGETPASVQDKLGPPTLVRRDGPVQVMLYESDHCVLDITFEEPSRNDYFRATHITARTPTGDAVETAPCIRRFQLDPYGTGAG